MPDKIPDIARLIRVQWEPRGGDAPLGWGADSYTVMVGDIPVFNPTAYKEQATKMANKLVKRIEQYLENGEA